MGFHFPSIVALLYLGVVGSCHASLPAELYWKSVFPNTPIPKGLQDLLRPGVNKNNFVKLKDAGLNVEYPYAKSRSTDDFLNNYRHAYSVDLRIMAAKSRSTDLEASKSGYENASIFFFENDIHPGSLMKLPGFTKTENQATFLPRAVADSLPFSSNKFSDILKLFSMDPKSTGAKVMKETIKLCEIEANKGEEKFCATSLESLIDQSVSRLGKKIQVLLDEVEKETEIEDFTIGNGVRNLGEKQIACHKMKYPYAVFLCHSIDKTAVYTVPLVGSDATKVKATAVCHKDTSTWNPKYLAFQVLKVKPGSVPICHFLAKETVVWVPN
ncbi:hypothetical protein SLA2020_093510 [Shorea laevis]